MRSVLALVIALLTGCAGVRDTRLHGTWVSDRAATVEHNRGVSPNMDWEKYSQIFGHLRITYDATTAISDFQGNTERRPLRLVRNDAESVTAEVWDDLDKKHRLVTMHFVDADTYFQVCCIAASKPAGGSDLTTRCRFRNRRYSRFGNLRYADFARLLPVP